MDAGGVVPKYMFMHNKSENEFVIAEVEYSWIHKYLGSYLVMEHPRMISALFECGPLPPVSTLHHARDECSQTFPVFATLCKILSIENDRWG